MGKKRALKNEISQAPLPENWRATYKQALRGLFVTGTSPGTHYQGEIVEQRKRSDDEPGLKT